MAVLKIITYPDPRLQQKSRPVEKWDKELYKLIEDMEQTLGAAPGLGLAAVQVGVSLQVFLYDENAGGGKVTKSYKAMINPEIIFREGEIKEEEGCLSIPDYRDTVVRAAVVRVKGFNKEGEPVEVMGEGLLARVFQHEIDHVNGVLFIERLSSLKRSLFLRRMKKLQRQAKAELAEKV
ncbi:MAG: peptide deformylase [Nitrospirota bacterium]|nr:peptide deformylase [Nitrospirota bacterium]